MTTNERVDVSRTVQAARVEADCWAEADPPYAELMACYADMGELLDSDTEPDDLKTTLRFLWRRRDAMAQRCDEHFAEQWAVWCAHNVDMTGVVNREC